jgi:two-component system LytT family sensor kinase
MLKTKTWLITIHVTCWLLFMALPLLFLNGGYQNTDFGKLVQSSAYWTFCVAYVSLFYINDQILVPDLFLKKRYLLYVLSVAVCCVLICLAKPYDKLLHQNGRSELSGKEQAFDRQPNMPPHDMGPGHHMGPPPEGMPPHNDLNMKQRGEPQHGEIGRGPGRPHMFDIISLFLFLVVMALSLAIRIIRQLQLTEKRAVRAEADKVSAELSFLKAQINPHFLFNTLNNIYTLAVIKDDNAPDSIMKLSNIMRYVTDDSALDFVSLKDEVDCITDYIALQKLRLGEKTGVQFEVSGDIAKQKIAPLILMTFIENVFKYGVSKREASTIKIQIEAAPGRINFHSHNRAFNNGKNNNRVGIGLSNTRKRLEHLYPGKHELSIKTIADLHSVKLILYT